MSDGLYIIPEFEQLFLATVGYGILKNEVYRYGMVIL